MMTIPVAHDFSCSWCWIGLFQVMRLKQEFGIEVEWRGYEIYPESSEVPVLMPFPKVVSNRPETPTRMALAFAAQGMEKPANRGPANLLTHHAHEAVELAKQRGTQDALVERIYRAYWEEAADIAEKEIVLALASPFVDREELARVLDERRFSAHVVEFDEPAHQSGVYNVPTFWIGGERFAEQPYVVLRRAVEAMLSKA